MGKALYLGLDPSHWQTEHELIHAPIIETIPFPYDSEPVLRMLENFSRFTHFIFTSKTTVRYFLEAIAFHNLSPSVLNTKHVISIGKATQKSLRDQGIDSCNPIIATQEGIIVYLEKLDIRRCHLCIPRSSLARKVLDVYLKKRQIPFFAFSLYETRMKLIAKNINIDEFDEIIFTSPSTVDAFFTQFLSIPGKFFLRSIGPITEKHLEKKRVLFDSC